MNVLYLDTSSSFLYCAFFCDKKFVFEITEKLEKKMSECVLDTIKIKFDENNLSTNSVNKIILVNGPGSFTGVRIGITIAKVYGFALNVPIITISSLYAMALSSSKDSYHIPLIDARRGYVYAAIYDSNYNTILEPKYMLLSDLQSYIKSNNISGDYISNDLLGFNTDKYTPNYEKIVSLCSDNLPTNNMDVNALYLKHTEAEEKLYDNTNK